MPVTPLFSSHKQGGGNNGVHHQNTMPEMQSEQQDHPQLGDLIRYITPEEIKNLLEQILEQMRKTNEPCTFSWIAAEECCGSYNWLNEKTPSILTPGKRPSIKQHGE